MPTPIHSSVASSVTFAPQNSFGPVESPTSVVPTLPDATDPLVGMVTGSDVGSAIAALVMMTQKEIRKAARQDRDLQYKAQENAQNEELNAMEKSADARFIAGIADGGLKLGSAGCSFASSANQFELAKKTPQLSTLDTAKLELDARNWEASGKGLEAYGVIGCSVGKLVSDDADRAAKAAGNRADTSKRLAEGCADDAHDADKSIDKAVEFLQQWLSGKAAGQQAALHRS
jgi:hypothetical protein